MPWFEEKDGCIIVRLRVVPRASKSGFAGLLGNALKVRIQAPPVDGKANRHLIRFLAEQWKVPRNAFELLSGESSRNKCIRIKNPTGELRGILRSFDAETGE